MMRILLASGFSQALCSPPIHRRRPDGDPTGAPEDPIRTNHLDRAEHLPIFPQILAAAIKGKRSRRQPGRVISPSSGSTIVVYHSTATRPGAMKDHPIRTATSAVTQPRVASTGGWHPCPGTTHGNARPVRSIRREQVNGLFGICRLPGPPITLNPLPYVHRVPPGTPLAGSVARTSPARAAWP